MGGSHLRDGELFVKPINKSMGITEWSLLFLPSMLWGGSFFFVGIAVSGLTPLTIAASRVGLAAVALHLFIRVMKLKIPGNRQLWTSLLFMGFLNNVIPFSLIAWGQTHIPSGLASILNATTPFFTIIVAHFLTKDEKITAGRLMGILVGLAGVVLIIGPQILSQLGTNILA
jgi:drug/metabolite transporter (DMT)-like permease